MKKLLISALTLLSLNMPTAFAEKPAAEALLHQMNGASQRLNFELSYILIEKNSIEPLLYRHAVLDEQQLEHLVYLSGPIREIIRRGAEVSYIEPGSDPFTIESGTMVAPIIPFLNADVDYLSKYYDFIELGRAREAGSACQVLRVVPKDGLRYSYVVWVDEKNKLPLRADLIDRDGEVLEQFRTISYSVSDQVVDILSGLNDVKLPEVLSLPKGQVSESYWHVNWIPNGFEAKELNRYRMANTERMVESQMYSDGLFNFSVYVADSDNLSLKGQLIRQGRRTLHSFVNGDLEVSVIGDIPPATAKRIAQSVVISPESAMP